MKIWNLTFFFALRYISHSTFSSFTYRVSEWTYTNIFEIIFLILASQFWEALLISQYPKKYPALWFKIHIMQSIYNIYSIFTDAAWLSVMLIYLVFHIHFYFKSQHFSCFYMILDLRARSTCVLQYHHFDNFVNFTSCYLDGDFDFPIPTVWTDFSSVGSHKNVRIMLYTFSDGCHFSHALINN